MKKILLIDDSDTYTWCLQKYLQHRGYSVKTACTMKEARAAIQEEMPLVLCCDLDLPDGSGMDFLDEVRAADKELPFILASCLTGTTMNRRLCAGARRCAWTK